MHNHAWFLVGFPAHHSIHHQRMSTVVLNFFIYPDALKGCDTSLSAVVSHFGGNFQCGEWECGRCGQWESVHKILCLIKAQSWFWLYPSSALRITAPPCRIELCKGDEFPCVPLCGEGRQLRRQLWALLTMSFMYKLAHFTFSTPGNIGFLFMKSRFSLLSPHITLLSSFDIFLGFPANNTDNFQIWDLGDSYSTSGRILSEYQVKPRTLSLHEPGLQG